MTDSQDKQASQISYTGSAAILALAERLRVSASKDRTQEMQMVMNRVAYSLQAIAGDAPAQGSPSDELLTELRRHEIDYPSLVHGPLCGQAADEIERLRGVAQTAPARDALAKTICEATKTYWWQTPNQQRENREWYDAADAVIALVGAPRADGCTVPTPDAQRAIDFCEWLQGYFQGDLGRDELTAFEANQIRNELNVRVFPPIPALPSTMRGATCPCGTGEESCPNADGVPLCAAPRPQRGIGGAE